MDTTQYFCDTDLIMIQLLQLLLGIHIIPCAFLCYRIGCRTLAERSIIMISLKCGILAWATIPCLCFFLLFYKLFLQCAQYCSTSFLIEYIPSCLRKYKLKCWQLIMIQDFIHFDGCNQSLNSFYIHPPTDRPTHPEVYIYIYRRFSCRWSCKS